MKKLLFILILLLLCLQAFGTPYYYVITTTDETGSVATAFARKYTKGMYIIFCGKGKSIVAVSSSSTPTVAEIYSSAITPSNLVVSSDTGLKNYGFNGASFTSLVSIEMTGVATQ